MKKIIKITVIIGIFLTCLFWVFKDFQLRDFFDTLKNLDLKLMGVAILILLLINVIRAYRFVLYLGFSIKKFHQMLYFYFAGIAMNLSLARSGDIFRAWIVFDKLKVNLVKSFVYLGVERTFDLFMVINLLCLGNIFILTQGMGDRLYQLMSIIFVLAIGMLLAIYQGGLLYHLIPFHWLPVPRKMKKTVKKQIINVLSGLKAIKSPHLLMSSLLLSLLIWIGEMCIYTMVLKATGVEVQFWESIMVISATIFSYLVPTIPGAIAVYEASVISSLKFLGKSGQLESAALILHSFYLVVTLTTGIPCLLLSRPNFRQIFQKIRNGLK